MRLHDVYITAAEAAFAGHDDVRQHEGLEDDQQHLAVFLIDILVWAQTMGVDFDQAVAEARISLTEIDG